MNMSSNDALAVLVGKRPGCFVVRKASTNANNIYAAISIQKGQDLYYHHYIISDVKGFYLKPEEDGGKPQTYFASLIR